MNRLYFLGAVLVLFAGWQLLVTCSNPLETDTDIDPEPTPIVDTIVQTDTVFLADTIHTHDTVYDTTTTVDTLFTSDTIFVVDSIMQIDTVIQTDTVMSVDTVMLVDTLLDVDTLTIVDTTVLVDTLTLVDTVTQTDTVQLVDTTVVFDTVEVVIPDSSCIQTVCQTISSQSSEAIWTFNDMAGTYLLTFEASVENNKPPKILIVTIDGVEHLWDTEVSMVFTVQATLSGSATVSVTPDQPLALGHTVYLCLTFVTP